MTGPGRRRIAPVACLTLLAIVGTLCACGRYGPPKRIAPQTPPASPTSPPSPGTAQ